MFLMAGCGDSSDESASGSSTTATSAATASGTKDACSLVNKTEAAAVLGGPVADPKPNTVGSGEQSSSSCDYKLASDALEGFSVTILHGQGQVDLFNQMKAQMGTDNGFAQDEPGIGDAAGCTRALLGAATFEVLKGQQVLQVTGQTCDEMRPAVKAAIARL